MKTLVQEKESIIVNTEKASQKSELEVHEQYNKKIVAFETETDSLKKLLNERTKAVDVLEDKVKEKEVENDDEIYTLRKEIKNLTDRANCKEDETQHLRIEIKNLADKTKTLDKCNHEESDLVRKARRRERDDLKYIKNLEGKVTKYKKLQEIQEKLLAQKSDKKSFGKILKEREVELERIKTELSSKEEQVQVLNEKILNFSSENEEKRLAKRSNENRFENMIKEKDVEIERIRTELSSKEEQVQLLDGKVMSMANEKEEKSREVDVIETKLLQKEAEIKHVEKLVQQKEEVIEHAQNAKKIAEFELKTALEVQMNKFNSENALLTKDLDDRTKDVKDLQDIILLYVKEREVHNDMLVKMEKTTKESELELMENHKAHIDRLKIESESLNTSLTDKTKEAEDLQEIIKEKEVENDDEIYLLRKQIKNLTDDNKATK